MPLGRLELEDETVQVVYDTTGTLKLLGSPGPKLMTALLNVSAANLITEDGQMRVIEFEESRNDGTVKFFFRK